MKYFSPRRGKGRFWEYQLISGWSRAVNFAKNKGIDLHFPYVKPFIMLLYPA
jgi:hypothetical protein